MYYKGYAGRLSKLRRLLLLLLLLLQARCFAALPTCKRGASLRCPRVFSREFTTRPCLLPGHLPVVVAIPYLREGGREGGRDGGREGVEGGAGVLAAALNDMPRS